MNAQLQAAIPAMGELNSSNHLIGDRQGLQAAWQRDGYWFFRDVLDKEVIANVRKTYLSYLLDMGAIKSFDANGKYRVGDVSKLPTGANVNSTPLNQRRVDRMITTAPTINAFFKEIFA